MSRTLNTPATSSRTNSGTCRFKSLEIGFVPQETFLFSETVRENIAFGAESATDDEVRAAAEAASIAAEIEGFPEQYQTMVGERGITLSGGQKQRTAIARAIIRNPRGF